MRSKSSMLVGGSAFLVLLFAVASVGQELEGARSGATGTRNLQRLALDPAFSQAVVVAKNSVRLKNQSVVWSGDVIANAAAIGDTLQSGYELALDPQASTSAGSHLKANRIWLKNNALVKGSVEFNALKNQGTILGAQTTPLALPVFATLPPFHSASAGGGLDVTVSAGGYALLPDGEYGNVNVGNGGTLLLSGGTYDLRSLSAGNGAQILFAAPAEVQIEGRLAAGSSAVLGPQTGSGVSPHDLVIYVAAINGNNGGLQSSPLAADLGNGSRVALSIYAPNGTVRLNHGTVATGAFVARDVLVETQAHLMLDSYFFNRPPVAAADDVTVDEGDTVSVLDSGALSVLANDSDFNGDPLTVDTTPVFGPLYGILSLAADGTFSYAHDGSETTADSFIYRVCDDGTPPLCATAKVSITVRPVNDPPVAVDDEAFVAQGGTVTVLLSAETSVLANDSDPENGALSVTTTPGAAPAFGTLTLSADGTFSFTHNGQVTADDSFVYAVCDDGVPVECSTARVTIAIGRLIRVDVAIFGLGLGRVVSIPAGIDCGATCTAIFDGSQTIQLVAEPFGTSVFSGFGGNVDCSDGLLSPDGDKFCTARFDLSAVPATLSVELAGTGGGRVVSAPSGIDCPGRCAAGFPIPTRVELTPIADDDSTFVGWTGDPDCEDGEVALFADTRCVATFAAVPPPPASFILTLVFTGGGEGTVTSNPAGVICDASCSVGFPENTALTLFARPLGAFGGWGGDCTGSGFSTPVLLDADKTCTVAFEP